MKKNISLFVIYMFYSVHFIYGQIPDWEWAKSSGGAGMESGNGVAVDAYGNTYVTGYYYSPTISFDTITLSNAGGNCSPGFCSDIFVAKFSPTGTALWAKSAGGVFSEYGDAVAVDGSGNCYVVGRFSSSILTFDTINLIHVGYYDMFIVKYDSAGNVRWAKSSAGCDVGGVAFDSFGNCYVAGYFVNDSVSFGDITLYNSGSSDIFIAKYDSLGNTIWAKRFGAEQGEGASAIGVDSLGNCYISGFFTSDSIAFDSSLYITLTGNNQNIFIAKFDSSGSPQWVKKATGNDLDYSQGISCDHNGGIYVTGYFRSSTLTFDTTVLYNSGQYDMFIVKYDASGNLAWAQKAGGTEHDWAFGISADEGGNIYLAGGFGSPSISFGSTTLFASPLGYDDIFVVKMDGVGNTVWAKSAGGTSVDDAEAISYFNGAIFITGAFRSNPLSFGSSVLASAGDIDFFIAKLSSTVGVIEEASPGMQMNIYPSPAAGNVTITIKNRTNENRLSVFNVLGEKVYTETLISEEKILNVENYLPGVYVVKITDGKNQLVKKLIIQ
jgi:hypothetical protein